MDDPSPHEMLVAVDITSGSVASYDLTEESARATDVTVGGAS